jgi:hypothetical protein
MAEYNNLSIDIDLEDMFDNLSDKDQVEFLVDMFKNLPDEGTRMDVVKEHILYLDDDTVADIITDTFWKMTSSDQKEVVERIADVMTPEQREALIEYINGI